MRTFLEIDMNLQFANTTRQIAAIVAVFGTLLSVGGTLTLADHYAQSDTTSRTWAQGVSGRVAA